MSGAEDLTMDSILDLDRDLVLKMYEGMLKIRLFEQTEGDIFARGEQEGFVHLYIGQEAIAVGTCLNLNKDDYITSTHRGHGHVIAKGGDMKQMMGELYGRSTGYCKGKSGSLHIADFDVGILGANGIVGAGIPIAVGAAYSIKLRGTQQVSVAFFGDGAMTQGAFHEAANMASAWDLPVILVVENNQWAVGSNMMRICKPCVAEDMSCRAAAYGMPGESVDGNDVVAVYSAVKKAVNRARNGEGPTLINCQTYRMRTHFEGDLDTRDEAEVEDWRKKDPINRLEKNMVEAKLISGSEIEMYKDRIQALVDEAVEFGRTSPIPQPEDALEHVYVEIG